MKKHIFAWLLVSVVAASLAACGGVSGTVTPPPQNPTITSVTVTANPTSITAAQTSQCSAVVAGTGSYSTGVTWTATGGTVSASGLFTPSTTLGTATCTATSTEDSTKSGSATITVNPVTVIARPVVSITATPSVITVGQTFQLTWSATGTGITAVSVSGPGLTTSSNATGSVTVGAPAGTDSYHITATNSAGSTSATAVVTVNTNTPAPTGSVTPSTTSVILGNTVVLTIATANASSCEISATDGSILELVPCNGTFTVTPATTPSVTYSVTATGSGGSTTLSSGPITVTVGQITLTSATPRAQWCVGQCGLSFPTVTFYGSNFVRGDILACTPDVNPQYGFSNMVNSGEWQIVLGIDQEHEGSGDRSCKICKNDGTGCSSAVAIGLYGPSGSGVDPNNGEMFSLNVPETCQYTFGGVPSTGQGCVDKFTSNGTPDGNIYVGAPTTSLAVSGLSPGMVFADARVYDETGNITDVPAPQGYPDPMVATFVFGDFFCALQPTAAKNVTCWNMSGSIFSAPPSWSVNMGTNPQSVTMGKMGNGKTYIYVLSADPNGITLWSADVSDGMTNIIFQPVTGVTAGLPQGSGLAAFDSSGILFVVSFGDDVAIPVSETALTSIGPNIALPGIPVSVVAHIAKNIAIVGTANPTAPGGGADLLDPVTRTATVDSSVVSPSLPWSPIPTDTGFATCPKDGTDCTLFPLP